MQSTNYYDIAKEYIEREIPVTPVKAGKGPFIDEWQKLGDKIMAPSYHHAWSEATGLALVTGPTSGIIALDIDIDPDCEDPIKLEIRKKLEEMLPPIFCARQGNPKRLPVRFYQYSNFKKMKFKALSVELLSDGNACVLPPSYHEPSDGYYKWVGQSLLDVDPYDLPIIPEEILSFLFEENEKAIIEASKKSKKKPKVPKIDTLLTIIKGRCKSGSYDYISRVGVALRYKKKTTEEMVSELLELDKKINDDADYRFFECKTRRWPKNNSMRENALKFVKEIEENHDPKNKSSFESDLAQGFHYMVETKQGIKDVPDYNRMAEYFNEVLRYRNDDHHSYIYDDAGYYRHCQSKEINSMVVSLTHNQAKPWNIDSFKKLIQAYCFQDFEALKEPKGLINLKNGVLDVESGELRAHDPAYFFKYALEHKYDPKAECPRFIQFLEDSFSGDKNLVNLIGEIMGYTIIGGDPTAHKAFVFYGEGRNGKSTCLDIIRELLGEKNTAAVSLKHIDKPFSMVRLDGKLANIVDESPGKIDPEAFKNIVGGGCVTAAHKGKPEYDLKVNARMIFACNRLPNFRESGVAIKERLVLVPFDNYVPAHKRDKDIVKKLKMEITGILNFALDGLKRYKENGFSKSVAIDKLNKEYELESDPVFSWFDENIEIINNFAYFVSTNDLYKNYVTYCEESGHRAASKTHFGRRLSAALRARLDTTGQDVNPNDFYKDNSNKDKSNNRGRGYYCFKFKQN